jgi:kynurenine formamidase
MRFFDLSVPLQETPSENQPLRLDHFSHEETAADMAAYFGARTTDLMGGYGGAEDEFSGSPHSGTHIDAPWHSYPTSGGMPARTIDELPVEWFFADTVVLDMRHIERGGLVSVDDVQTALEEIGYALKPLDIVLIQTGADKLWGTSEYMLAGVGMAAEATRWLIDQGIRVMGIDAWGWDQPFWAMRSRYARTGDARVIWEAHRVTKDMEYCHIERLANLDSLPRPYGFKLACFPIKLHKASAGWTRAVAIFED